MALVFNLILMLTMAGALALSNLAFTDSNRDKFSYLFEQAPSSGEIAGSSFFSFYLILNSFIPLELPVVIEISKMLTTSFMQNDFSMMQINRQF